MLINKNMLKECKSNHHTGKRKIPVDNFSKHPQTKDGLQSYCKQCMSIAQRNWYTKDKQKKNSDRWWERRRQTLKEETGIEFSSPSQYRMCVLRETHPEKYILFRTRDGAKKRNMTFDLTLEDINIPEVCPVLGIPLYFSGEEVTDNTPSVDRVDSTKGYTKDNIVVISWRANRIKSDGTPIEHKKVYEFFEGLNNPNGY